LSGIGNEWPDTGFRILEGNAHVNNVINKEEKGDYAKISSRIEKDKAMFGGCEITGKTLVGRCRSG
jgi:hypothetical protein